MFAKGGGDEGGSKRNELKFFYSNNMLNRQIEVTRTEPFSDSASAIELSESFAQRKNTCLNSACWHYNEF